MNKKFIKVAFVLALVVGIFSFSKYLDMSMCCQVTCEPGVAMSAAGQCDSNHALSTFHHLEMINSFSAVIPNIGSFAVFVLALFAAVQLWRFAGLGGDIKQEIVKYRYKAYIRLLGRQINPFDTLRFLRAEGIIGSQKNFA